MKITPAYPIAGHPVMGTFGGWTYDLLVVARDAGMNLVFGSGDYFDADTRTGKFCLANGIRAVLGIAGHVHGKPRLARAINPRETDIPIAEGTALPGPAMVRIDDELIRYREATPTTLRRCERGAEGTEPASHPASVILFWPEPLAAQILSVKDSPNLWGYWALDDSPGNARSAMRAMYATVKRMGDTTHPVCAGHSGATTLHNFTADSCDVVIPYYYPILRDRFDHAMTALDTQQILTDVRKRAPGKPFIGVTQGFWGGYWNRQEPLTERDLREQAEDFIREGSAGIMTFSCAAPDPTGSFHTWNSDPALIRALRDIHDEIRRTGGLAVPPERPENARYRIQPVGYYERANDVPGIPPAWYIIGPFDAAETKSLDAEFPPDRAIDLVAKYQGKGTMVGWERHPSHAGAIGFVEVFGTPEFLEAATAYAYCTVTADRRRDLVLHASSDDDMVVRFNGREVYRHVGMRGVHFLDDMAPVTLEPGKTEILAKVYNYGHQFGFSLRFAESDGRPAGGLRFSPE